MRRRVLYVIFTAFIILTLLSLLVFLPGCGRALRRQALLERMEEKENEETAGSSTQIEDSSEETMEGQDNDSGMDEETQGQMIDGQDQEALEQDDSSGQEEAGESGEMVADEDSMESEDVDVAEDIDIVEDVEEEVQEQEEAVQQAEATTLSLPIVIDESGSILKGAGNPAYGIFVYAGDTELNSPVRGYVSFDIRELSGATVNDAKIELKLYTGEGDFFELKESLCVSVISWGTRQLKMEDFDKNGPIIGCYNAPNVGQAPDALKNELQKAIDAGKKRFQISLWGKGPATDNDDIADRFLYKLSEEGSGISMTLTYTAQ